MQIMIDTAVDTADDMYRIGKYLVDAYAPEEMIKVSDIASVTVRPIVASSSLDLNTCFLAPMAPAEEKPIIVNWPSPGSVPPPPAPVFSPTEFAANLGIQPAPLDNSEPDSAGSPWDARIHASNRAKKIDGTWKNRRGGPVDAPLAPTSAPPAATELAQPSTAAVPPPPPSVTVAAPATLPTTAAIVTTVVDFRSLMQKIQSATMAGKLSVEQVNAALASIGLKPEEMAQLIGNVLLISSVNAAIDKYL